ncbi:MAG TPA: HlyD family type I secretion periplasmic adaptor subunit [Gammaproteobacteria bacterium]
MQMFNRAKQIWTKLKASISNERASRAELEFLPAALEVIETPPSPAGRVILWTIIAFFLIALLWACIGKVDIVAVAQGKIVPSGRVKVIQPLEAGVVEAIHVEEGQRVEAGQLLLELDSTLSEADRKRLENEWLAAELDRARLKALIDAVDQKISEDLKIQPYLDTHILQYSNTATANLAQQRLTQQHNEYLAQAASLYQEVLEQQAELRAVDEHIEQLNGTIPLITERAQAIKSMLDSGVVSRADWLKIEEERIGQVKERDIQQSNRQRITAAIESAKQQQQALSAKYRSEWLGELTATENRIEAAEQELIKAEQRSSLQKLLAPVSGKIQQLAVHTIGGVVTPAQPLMMIVPDSEAIEVEAWVQNKDIGFVEAGHAVEIKIETFPFTKYGVIDGEIRNLSNDAVSDEEKGLHYVAQVSMAKTTIQADNKLVNLTPGMAVTVEVKTGKRRVIDYLLSPLLRYKEESIQER